jgi:adenine deaminase
MQDHWPLERILPLMTCNPARLLKLRHKGSIAVGADADLLVLSHDTLQLRYLYSKGVLRKTPQWTQVQLPAAGSHPVEMFCNSCESILSD